MQNAEIGGFVLGSLVVGIVLGAVIASGHELKTLIRRFLPKTDIEKAVAERQVEIDRRAAQLIREHGYTLDQAERFAEIQYTNDMEEATP